MKRQVMRPFLCFLLSVVVNVTPGLSYTGLRGSSFFANRRTIDVRITVFHTLLSTGEGEEHAFEIVGIPLFDGEEGHEAFPYRVKLPNHIRQAYEQDIDEGRLHLSITDAAFDGDAISTTEQSKFLVLEQGGGGRRLNKPFNQTIGRRTLAVVLVSTTSGQRVSYDHTQLRQHLFEDDAGMAAQFYRCSLNQLTWESAGFYDVVIEGDINDDYELPMIARDVALSKLIDEGIVQWSAQELADNVMVVLPQGTKGMLANAGVDYWLSTFNDVWSLDLLTVIHELSKSQMATHPTCLTSNVFTHRCTRS